MRRFKYFSYTLFITFLSLLFVTQMAEAQNDAASIKKLLEERDDEIKELMGPQGTEYDQEQRNKLKDIINSVIDYPAMAQYALQDTYETLSEEDQEEFVNLFSTIIRDQSLNKLDIYRAKVKYEEITVDGNSADVETLAQLENVRTPVGYAMEYESDTQQWVVTDMIIDDVSTADSYRRQFQKIISQKGYDSLIETLRKRAAR